MRSSGEVVKMRTNKKVKQYRAIREEKETKALIADRLKKVGSHYFSSARHVGLAKIKGAKPEDLHDRLRAAATEYYSLPEHEQHRLHQESMVLRNNKPMITPFGGNPKTSKETPGMVTTLLHLPSHKASGINTCEYEQGCAGGCIDKTGNPGSASAKTHGRLDRLHHMYHNPLHAIAHIDHEVTKMKKVAAKSGKKLGIRLNGTSDLPWHKIAPQMFDKHKDVQFYDYTKNYDTIKDTSSIPKNYDITFSSTGLNHPGSNWHHAKEYLDKGGKVAMTFARMPKITRKGVVVGGHHLPTHVHDEATGKKYKVHNGDMYDARSEDHAVSGTPKGEGLIVGLSYKRSKKYSWKNAPNFAVKGGKPRNIINKLINHGKNKQEIVNSEDDIVTAHKGLNPEHYVARDAPATHLKEAHTTAADVNKDRFGHVASSPVKRTHLHGFCLAQTDYAPHGGTICGKVAPYLADHPSEGVIGNMCKAHALEFGAKINEASKVTYDKSCPKCGHATSKMTAGTEPIKWGCANPDCGKSWSSDDEPVLRKKAAAKKKIFGSMST